MLNLNNFIISLKCSWIKRVLRGRGWVGGGVMGKVFKAVFGDIVAGCLEFGDCFIIKLVDKCNNIFWKDVFDAWLNVMNKHLN